MNRTYGLVGAGLVGATLLGSVAIDAATAAPASAATSHAVAASADVTRGFNIVNMTKHTLQLRGVDAPGERDGYAPVGATIAPGQSYHYEKIYYFAKKGETTLTFSYTESLSNGSQRVTNVQVTLVVDALSATSIRTDAGDVLTVDNKGLSSGSLTLSDKDFSTITVPASDAQKQAELLNETCVSGLASCTFLPNTKVPGESQVKLVAGGANNTATARPESFTTKFVASTESSVETTGSAKLTISGILEAGLTHKWGGKWTDSREVTDVHNYTIGAYKNFNLWSRVLTDRVTGDFTVTLGKTTWKLTGVYFDIPNKDAKVLYDSSDSDLTEQEKASLPKIAQIRPVN